ncbi:MAG: secondary thiamine-phosphate synthase enzyme YjbQ [Thermodesulfobacteriota bacterium]
MDYINVKTSTRNELLDVTSEVQDYVSASGVREGLCFLFVPHTTGAVTINEGADPSVRKDIARYLEKLIPKNGNFSHAEGNSDAHIKTSLVGSSEILAIEDGRLVLGTWQAVFFCEFDGPRTRRLGIRIIPAPGR